MVAVAVAPDVRKKFVPLEIEKTLVAAGMPGPVTGMPMESTDVPLVGKTIVVLLEVAAPVRSSAVALIVAFSVRLTAPLPNDRLLPLTVKPCFQVIALAEARVIAVPATLLTVTALPSWKRPLPTALAEPRFRVPFVKFRPPEPVLAPESVRVPEPVLVIGPAKSTGPVRASEEPLAPVPTTLQVCAPAATSGAEMVIAPALSLTAMPLAELPGVSVSVPEVPCAMAIEGTPVSALKIRLSTDRLPSRVRLLAPAVTLLVPKTKASVRAGRAPVSIAPETSVAQLVSPALLARSELPWSPLKKAYEIWLAWMRRIVPALSVVMR